jgi:hypothetical protein
MKIYSQAESQNVEILRMFVIASFAIEQNVEAICFEIASAIDEHPVLRNDGYMSVRAKSRTEERCTTQLTIPLQTTMS